MGNASCVFRFRSPELAKKLVETTHYSLSTAAPERPDRRQDERYVSLLRVGALVIRGRRELCLIRNISAGGMMIRPYSPVMPGSRLSVELKHGEAVDGVAQWSDKGLVGVVFDAPIDVLALLSATEGTPRPRMPRIDLSCSASVRCDGDVFRAQVVNISQGGICVKSSSEVEVDANVVVSLIGLHAAAGVVKWRDREYYGIGFNRVYPVHELMAFLSDQQRHERERRSVA
jgi:PilZ domain